MYRFWACFSIILVGIDLFHKFPDGYLEKMYLFTIIQVLVYIIQTLKDGQRK